MKQKKKLLIVNNNLHIGGIQKALVNLLKLIENEYDITLFLFKNIGELACKVPESVKIIEAKAPLSLLGVSQSESKKMGLFWYMVRALFSVYSKLISNHFPLSFLTHSQQLNEEFDVAISFMQGSDEHILYGGVNEFIIGSVTAKMKIAAVHCDFIHYEGNNAYNISKYECFDKIYCVSKGCRKSFLTAAPQYSDKTYMVYNVCDAEEVIALSEVNPVEFDKEYFNIVTAARISKEKGILRTLPLIKRLKGYKVIWHIVGDGALLPAAKQYVSDNDISDMVVFYGIQSNPYRIMKNADLMLVPSYHEAAPMVFTEAEVLNLRVLSTDTTSAVELVCDRQNGFVCKNTDESILEILKHLIKHPEQLKYKLESKDVNENVLSAFNKLTE